MCNGLENGFDTKVSVSGLPVHECKNNLSACTSPAVIGKLIKRKCEKGFMYRPFEKLPFENYRVSPLGLATGKYSGKERLILDLSAPHDEKTVSVNELIDKKSCSMAYVKIDDAIEIIMDCGKGA